MMNSEMGAASRKEIVGLTPHSTGSRSTAILGSNRDSTHIYVDELRRGMPQM